MQYARMNHRIGAVGLLRAVRLVQALIDIGVVPRMPSAKALPDSQTPSLNAVKRVWDVLELVECLARWLSRNDQARLAGVSRSIWWATMPLLWKHLPERPWNGHICRVIPFRSPALNGPEELEGSSQVGFAVIIVPHD